MKIASYCKTNYVFFVVLFLLFIGLLSVLYSNYPYYPDPLPNEYRPPPPVQAPGK